MPKPIPYILQHIGYRQSVPVFIGNSLVKYPISISQAQIQETEQQREVQR